MTLDLPALGWDERFRTAYAQLDRPDRQPARVTTVDRGVYGLLTAAGPARATIGGGLLAAAAWLVGRGEGAELTVEPPGPLPVVPPLG